MYSVRLVDVYSKVIFHHKKNHKNKNKYRHTMLTVFIAIIAFIFFLSSFLTSTFIKENLFELFFSGVVILFTLLLVADEILQKMYFLQIKDKEQIFFEVSHWLKEHIPLHSLKVLNQIIEKEIERNSKNHITFIVITGALTLAVWQSFARGILTELGLLEGVVFLLISVIVISIIAFAFNKIIYFILHLSNSHLKYLRELDYIIKEHIVRMDKLQNEDLKYVNKR